MDGTGLWPWWLWVLATLWIGTSLVWRPAATSVREQTAWIALAVIHAGLIVFVARIVPSPAETANVTTWPTWWALIAFLVSAIACVGNGPLPWQQGAGVAAAVWAGVVLALLRAPEAAVICGIMAWGLARTAPVKTDDVTKPPPADDPALIALAAVITLVVTIGLCRYALVVESSRGGLSRSQTAFPSREWLARHHGGNARPHSPNPELWALAVITGVALFTTLNGSAPTIARKDVPA